MKVKRLAAVFLAATMILGCAPANIWAESEESAFMEQEADAYDTDNNDISLMEFEDNQAVSESYEEQAYAETDDLQTVQEIGETTVEPESDLQQTVDNEIKSEEQQPAADNDTVVAVSESDNSTEKSDSILQAAVQSELLDGDNAGNEPDAVEEDEAEIYWTVSVYAPGVEGYQNGELYSEFTVEDGDFSQ